MSMQPDTHDRRFGTDADECARVLADNRRFIQAVIRRFLWDATTRRDVAQTVLEKAFRAWPNFDNRCKPQTWLYRIAVNECTEANRQTARRRRLFVRSEDLSWYEDPSAPDGLAALEQEEIYGLIARALDQAGDRCRQAFELYYVEELRGAEAARRLGITESAFFMRLKTARDTIRSCMRGRESDND
jgi:RNA polymerase sigma-70 factor (ECF subfamily)